MSNSRTTKDDGPSPKLRFPEFDGKKLHSVRLGEVTDEPSVRNRGKLTSESVMGVRKDNGIVPMQERLVAADISRYKIVKNKWFAYNPMRLNIGSIARWSGEKDVLVSPDYVVFRCLSKADPTGILPDYLDHFRRTEQWDTFVNGSGDGGVRVRIYYHDLSQMRVILPTIDEQKKIAECLSSLDALICAETEKLNALEDQKRGLMQRLFPRPERIENGERVPAETKPRLRFPEFEGTGDWETETIGNSTTSFSGGTPSTTDPSCYGGITPFIRSAEIDSVTTELTLTDHGLDNSSAKLIDCGDVLIAMYGANSGNAAISRISGAINQAVLCLRHEHCNEFLFQFWCSRQQWVTEKYLQGGQGNLSANIIKSIPIPTPKESEQSKIANVLGALDKVISGQLEQLGALKCHQSGLLQQLFPVEGEVQA